MEDYYSKQPNFDAVYINYGNNLNPDLKNETITGYGSLVMVTCF